MNKLIQSRDFLSDPWGSFFPLRTSRAFGNGTLSRLPVLEQSNVLIDIKESDSDYQLAANLPGIPKEQISVSVNDDVLTISGESASESSQESNGEVIRQERFRGKFVRSLRLNETVDEANIEANYKDGVLNVVLPKRESAQPRKVEVVVQ